MSHPDRIENQRSPREASGVYARTREEATQRASEDPTLEMLVERASNRPPAMPDASGEFAASIFGRDEITPLATVIGKSERPKAIVTGAMHEAMSPAVRVMLVVPWLLLAIGALSVVLAWPRGGSATVEPDYALAPIPQGVNPAGATAPLDVAPSEFPDLVFDEEFVPRTTNSAIGSPVATEVATTAAEATDPQAALAIDAGIVAAETIAPIESSESLASETIAPALVLPTDPATAELEAPTDPEVLATASQIRAHLDPAAAIPAHPSRAEVARAMRSVAALVDACTPVIGSATIRVTIANDGHVSAATALGEFAGTGEGTCMESAVSRVRLAPFTESSLTVTYPFVLR